MRTWSIPFGRLSGIEVRVHWTFPALLVFVWISEYAMHSGATPGRGLALVGIVFGSVLLHEAAHAVAARRAGTPLRSLILLPVGGVGVYEDKQQAGKASGRPSWRKQLQIILAGPLISVAAGLAAAAVVRSAAPQVELWTRHWVHSSNLPRSLVWTNVLLGALNLLPAYPLDGGRILRAWLARRMEPGDATRRAVMLGQAIATCFMFAGMFSNVQSNSVLSLNSSVWLTLVGVFMFLAAQIEERSVVFQSVLENVCMEDVMLTDFATLSPGDTLEDALEKAVHSLQDDFPVIRGSDMVGVISRRLIVQALRARGNSYVQSAMSRFFEVAQRRESLASAFRKITAQGLTIIPVVEEQRLIGIVTLQNLMHNMALLAETRKLRRQALDL
jgi:Zn-dependent protease/CBS domain-containing protein